MTSTRKKSWEESVKLQAFIRELRNHGNVSDALRKAQAGRGWVYGWRTNDAEFKDAFEEARTCGLEVLKDEAHRRAYGFNEPVYRINKAGKRVRVGETRKYSDTLLMFLIKQSDPSYREHFQIDHGNANSRPFLFQMSLHPDALAAQEGKT